MANRNRKIKLEFYVSEEEKNNIKLKMKQANIENFSHYARKMLLDNFVVNLNSCEDLLKLNYEINKIGNNINQLTKLANENKAISKSTINQIAKIQEDLSNFVKERVGVIFGIN